MMGLLDYDIELAKQAIQKIPGLLNDVTQGVRDKFGMNNARNLYAMRNLDGMAGGDLQANRAANNKQFNQKMINVGLDMNPAAVGQIVWHGSPHKFDKFDMRKIGTGEGAQAYGHGLYMAEAPETAQMYRASVAAEKGKSFGLEDGPIKGIATLIAARGQKGEEMARKAYAGQVPDIDAAISAAKDAVHSNSQLYKVDIPDEAVARFLDWDKPLSQQAPEVQAAMNKLGIAQKETEFYGMTPDGWGVTRKGMSDPTDLYRMVADGNNAEAARKLKELGIPGIRYLDGVSRGAGQGSSNFVLFDDQMPRILEINGNPTGNQAWKPGEWKGLLE